MLLPQSLTSRALAWNKGTIEQCGKRQGVGWGGGAALALGPAFDRGLIKGCESRSATQAAEWGLMGYMHA